MSIEAWIGVGGIIATVLIAAICGVWAISRNFDAKLQAKDREISDQNQENERQRNAYVKEKISESEDRQHGQFLDLTKKIDRLEAAIEYIKENRHKDMLEIVDRMTTKMGEIERAAHIDRLQMVQALGKVEGALGVVNASNDRATKDIGGIQTTLNELTKQVSAIGTRQEDKDLAELKGKV